MDVPTKQDVMLPTHSRNRQDMDVPTKQDVMLPTHSGNSQGMDVHIMESTNKPTHSGNSQGIDVLESTNRPTHSGNSQDMDVPTKQDVMFPTHSGNSQGMDVHIMESTNRPTHSGNSQGTNVLESTNRPTHSGNSRGIDVLESTNRPSHSRNRQEGTKHGVGLPNQKLPNELLLYLFSYLTVIPDLVTVQRVCTGWKVAAQDKCLWKRYTFIAKRLSKEKKFIKLMPGLKYIKGYARNKLLLYILKYVWKLKRLNCKFDPPLSAFQVRVIFNWYPKLESINLCLFAPDILKSVEMLKTNRYLKEVVLYSPDKYDLKYMIPSTVISVFNIFNDEQNFSALRYFSLSMCQFLHPFVYSGVWNAITNIIKKRSQQLLKLNIGLINVAVHTANAINMCSNLRHLSVELRNEEVPIDLRIHNMSQLKYLKVVMYEEKPYFIRLLNDSLYKCSWEHLTEVFFKVKSEKFRTLETLIENAKQLRKLHYMDMTLSVCNSELQQLSSLSKLVDLYVAGFRTISEDGMKHVSMCRNLQRLDLYGLNSDIGNMYPCISATISSMKWLYSLSFEVYNLPSQELILRNRLEIETFIGCF